MKNVIVFVIFAVTFQKASAQIDTTLFKTATIKTLDTTKFSITENIWAASAPFLGIPADSIKKISGTFQLYFGNYMITMYKKEDYLFYITKAVDQAILKKEAELKRINSMDGYGYSQQQRQYQTPQSGPTRTLNSW